MLILLSPSLNKTKWLTLSIFLLSLLVSAPAHAETTADVTGVKTYLVKTVEKMKAASSSFVTNAEAYNTALAKGEDVQPLIKKLQEDYKAMDSFGYETVEGIVAGIDSLAPYDTYLDSGTPKTAGSDNMAPVTLDLGKGQKIDQEGALFTYIIEPALWGSNAKWMTDSKKGKVPRPEVLLAAGKDVDRKIGELLASSQKLDPVTKDLVSAMITMTPTLSEYFEEWKESRYGDQKGKFQAVSRVSDMRGILGSCSLMYDAVHAELVPKDKALATSIQNGFKDIMAFIENIDARKKKGSITTAQIDELAEQAKARTDKLVPQIEQAQALVAKK